MPLPKFKETYKPWKDTHTDTSSSKKTNFPIIQSPDVSVQAISTYAMGWRSPQKSDYAISSLRTNIDKVNLKSKYLQQLQKVQNFRSSRKKFMTKLPNSDFKTMPSIASSDY